MLPLDGLKLKDVDSGFMSTRARFALFNASNRNIYRFVGGCLCPGKKEGEEKKLS